MLRPLIRKILLFILAVVLVDFLFGKCLNFINAHTEKGDYGRNNYICNEADQDIMIFGSSRAIHHYNPDVFEKNLGMSCYNCGEDGMGIILSYGRYKLAQRKHQPKLLICDIEVAYDLLKNDNTKYLGFLKPYYDIPGIDSLFWEVSATERYKMLSNTYRYNSRWLDIVAQYRSKSNVYARDYKYSPLSRTMDYEPSSYVFASNEDCDELKIEIWNRLLNDCERNNTKVFFVISPVYGEKSNCLLEPFKELVRKHGIVLLDHFSDERFINNRELFADKMHLNTKGSNQLSEMISEEISRLIE